jgi:Protein of unknown function (DUF2934)
MRDICASAISCNMLSKRVLSTSGSPFENVRDLPSRKVRFLRTIFTIPVEADHCTQGPIDGNISTSSGTDRCADRRRRYAGAPSHEDIAREAYARFCARGYEHGQNLDDWLEAERETARAPSNRPAGRDRGQTASSYCRVSRNPQLSPVRMEPRVSASRPVNKP